MMTVFERQSVGNGSYLPPTIVECSILMRAGSPVPAPSFRTAGFELSPDDIAYFSRIIAREICLAIANNHSTNVFAVRSLLTGTLSSWNLASGTAVQLRYELLQDGYLRPHIDQLAWPANDTIGHKELYALAQVVALRDSIVVSYGWDILP